MVDTKAVPAEAAAGRVPVGSEIVTYAEGEGSGAPFEVLRRQVMISGEQLINAQQSYDPQSNQPVVSIRFDSGGSSTFAKVTAQHAGKRFRSETRRVGKECGRTCRPGGRRSH